MEKDELYRNLSEIFGPENVTVTFEDLIAYEGDDNRLRVLQVYLPEYQEKFLPNAVVLAEDKKQIVELVNFANGNAIPLIPRAGASSLHGQLVPIKGGIIVDITRMDKILEINNKARYVTVQPGVLYKELNRELEPFGYWFPPDPGSSDICRIGGMVGNNASGVRACKYGVTADFVLGLEVVLPNGQIIRTGGKTLKSSSGLNLKHLFVGSEGTLGIITEIILRIDPKPSHEMSTVIGFQSLEDACTAASEIMGAGLIPASMELVGPIATMALNALLPEDLKMPDKSDNATSNLLIRTDGDSERNAKEDMERILNVVDKFNPVKKKSYTQEESEHVWIVREESTVAGRRLGRTPREHYMTGSDVIGDFGVPLDKVPEFVKGTAEICKKYRLSLSYIGHISDGNIHLGFAYRRPDKRSARLEALAEREMAEFVVKLGGTLSAEHGAGLWMSHLLPLEHGESLELMRAIKKLIDPNDIMNPGKMALDFIPDIVDPLNWYKEEK